MKNTEVKFFIDTTVAVSALTGRNKDAWILLETGKKRMVSLFVNDFVIKEIRRTLKELDFSQEKINYSVDYVSQCCAIMKNAPKARFSKYDIQDKNDLPVLVGATQESAVLVTEDNILKKDAKKYLECETPSEALKRLSIR
jgi:predicted nucleic acid-binding protein